MFRRSLVLVSIAAGFAAFGTGVAQAAVPDPPTSVTVVPGNAKVAVRWHAPASNGGSTITVYTATSSPGSKTCTTTGALTCTVTGLTNGTSYTFTVTATNGSGTSAPSTASAAVTPAALPGAPTNATATVTGSGQAKVTWTAPSSTGGPGVAITKYTVSASGSGGQTCTRTTGPLSCTVTDLVNGVSYTFTVTATNTTGTGAASAASNAVTPTGAPPPPTGVTAVAGDQQATVSCTAPATNGGATITSYTATASPGGAHASAPSCPVTVTGLTDGTAYTFTVTVSTSLGTSVASAASANVTPVDTHPPAAPGGVSGHIAAGALTLSWQAAADNVGVVRYEIYLNGAPIVSVAANQTTATFRAFEPKGQSVYTVRAFDAAGNQGASSGSVIARPTPASKVNVPGWAWKLLAWQQHGQKGPRPTAAPKRLPHWWAAWKHWRLSPFEIVS